MIYNPNKKPEGIPVVLHVEEGEPKEPGYLYMNAPDCGKDEKDGLNAKVASNLNIGNGQENTVRTCPKCGKEYQERPAISRTDNKTEICPVCGVREALEAAGISKEAQEDIIKEVNKAKKGAGL